MLPQAGDAGRAGVAGARHASGVGGRVTSETGLGHRPGGNAPLSGMRGCKRRASAVLPFPQVSPTIFRSGDLRFFFFSREERRIHIHVECDRGIAKIWMEPRIEVAENHGLPSTTLTRALWEIRSHEIKIRQAWREHFGS
jgi:hypothetical protein